MNWKTTVFKFSKIDMRVFRGMKEVINHRVAEGKREQNYLENYGNREGYPGR